MKDEEHTREASYLIRCVGGSAGSCGPRSTRIRQHDTCGILGSIQEEEKKDESSSGGGFDGSRLRPQRPRLPLAPKFEERKRTR